MKVSVCMITYGHGQFIRQAIEGVLLQECDFEVELIIANDCSPDDTDEVIKDIQKNNKRASWIKYTRQEKNIGMIANFLFALQQCNGKYIAFCEGDDYWTDPLKLQKQREVFLSNPDIGLVHTNYKIFIQDTGLFIPSPNRDRITGVNEIYDNLIKNNFIATLTVMAERKILLKATQKLTTVMDNWAMGDYPLWLYVAAKSSVAYLPQCTAIYRHLPTSASHSNSLIKILKFIRSGFLIRLYFHKNIRRTSSKNIIVIYFIFYYESWVYIYRKLK